MKEKVLEALAALGFNAECIDNTGYGFNYEGKHFLFLPNENDDEFLSICLPGIYDYKEDKIGEHCAITEKLNSTLKYVKAYTIGDSIWLFYERELMGDDDLENIIPHMYVDSLERFLSQIIPHMIVQLDAGLRFAFDAIKEIEASFSEDSDADATSDVEAAELYDDPEDDKDE